LPRATRGYNFLKFFARLTKVASQKRGSTSKKRGFTVKKRNTSEQGHYIMTTIACLMQLS